MWDSGEPLAQRFLYAMIGTAASEDTSTLPVLSDELWPKKDDDGGPDGGLPTRRDPPEDTVIGAVEGGTLPAPGIDAQLEGQTLAAEHPEALAQPVLPSCLGRPDAGLGRSDKARPDREPVADDRIEGPGRVFPSSESSEPPFQVNWLHAHAPAQAANDADGGNPLPAPGLIAESLHRRRVRTRCR